MVLMNARVDCSVPNRQSTDLRLATISFDNQEVAYPDEEFCQFGIFDADVLDIV